MHVSLPGMLAFALATVGLGGCLAFNSSCEENTTLTFSSSWVGPGRIFLVAPELAINWETCHVQVPHQISGDTKVPVGQYRELRVVDDERLIRVLADLNIQSETVVDLHGTRGAPLLSVNGHNVSFQLEELAATVDLLPFTVSRSHDGPFRETFEIRVTSELNQGLEIVWYSAVGSDHAARSNSVTVVNPSGEGVPYFPNSGKLETWVHPVPETGTWNVTVEYVASGPFAMRLDLRY